MVHDIKNSAAKDKAISQHRYLQNLIKKIAEYKGYRAAIGLSVLRKGVVLRFKG